MDATCKVQDNIHVFRLVHNMCPGFWVHIILRKVFFVALVLYICDCLTSRKKQPFPFYASGVSAPG